MQRLILREALTLVLGGLLVGLPTAVLAAHGVGKLLYGAGAPGLRGSLNQILDARQSARLAMTLGDAA